MANRDIQPSDVDWEERERERGGERRARERKEGKGTGLGNEKVVKYSLVTWWKFNPVNLYRTWMVICFSQNRDKTAATWDTGRALKPGQYPVTPGHLVTHFKSVVFTSEISQEIEIWRETPLEPRNDNHWQKDKARGNDSGQSHYSQSREAICKQKKFSFKKKYPFSTRCVQQTRGCRQPKCNDVCDPQ